MIFKKYHVLIIAAVALYFSLSFYFLATNQHLHFSDAAKFADIGRNLISGNRYGLSFSFFPPRHSANSLYFYAGSVPPAMPLLFAFAFHFFDAIDSTVISVSIFLFILLVLSVYWLGKRFFSTEVGFLSAVAVSANINFLDYATSGASEVLFTLEIVVATVLFSYKKRLLDVLGFGVLLSMYFTRPQAFIPMAAIFLFWLLNNFKVRKAGIVFVSLAVVGLLVDKFILLPLSWAYPVSPIFARGIEAIFIYAANPNTSDGLRGSSVDALTYKEVFIRFFYNVYNFYKALPSIMPPYLLAFFAIGIFIQEKRRDTRILKYLSIMMFVLFIVLAAITIPFHRYIHPVTPLIYVFAIASIYRMLPFNNPGRKFVTVSVLLFFFTIATSIGNIFLDTRFNRGNKNINMPPIYKVLALELASRTPAEALIVTNLDTWGSWYGARRTIWFPLEPAQLQEVDTKTGQIEYIYLTDYLIDDENYYMNEAWRQALFDSENLESSYLGENYEVIDTIEISPSQVFENTSGRAVLLRRKDI